MSTNLPVFIDPTAVLVAKILLVILMLRLISSYIRKMRNARKTDTPSLDEVNYPLKEVENEVRTLDRQSPSLERLSQALDIIAATTKVKLVKEIPYEGLLRIRRDSEIDNNIRRTTYDISIKENIYEVCTKAGNDMFDRHFDSTEALAWVIANHLIPRHLAAARKRIMSESGGGVYIPMKYIEEEAKKEASKK